MVHARSKAGSGVRVSGEYAAKIKSLRESWLTEMHRLLHLEHEPLLAQSAVIHAGENRDANQFGELFFW